MLKGASLLVDVVITQTGYAGQTVTLDVEDDGRIVGSQKVQLPADGSPATVRVRATRQRAGPARVQFKVAPQQGEVVTQNNARDSLVDVRDTREKILYFEGEPRFEMKFIRRAVADDKNLQIVTLQRTADNKFLRLDVDRPTNCSAASRRRATSCSRSSGLILGSIEAARVQRRPAADDRRLRRSPRRRPADARRRALVRRRRLRRHAGRRRAAAR